jgi:hypothetical protein
MGRLSAKLRSIEGNRIGFWCPGCDSMHVIVAKEGRWTWDGNAEMPTFSPSVLVRGGHYAPGHSGACWCTYNAEHPDQPAKYECSICHSFVTKGRIQFLDDCTHHLKGHNVDLPDFPDNE